MSSEIFPLDEYCARIGTSTAVAATVECLEDLQRSQAYAIPFENFDIQLGKGIDLDPKHLIDKLIRSRRGGYCFELNGLFLAAIQRVGYEARALLARVHHGGEPSGRGHQVNLVTIDNRQWIADVGFGGMCPRVPILLEHNKETTHDGVIMRLCQHELGHLLQRKLGDGWMDLYSFDLAPVVANDIVYGNHFTSTHPSSFFTTSRVAVLCDPEGETRLLNFTCTTNRKGEETVDELSDDDSYLLELKTRFGIELDASYENLAPLSHTH